MKFTAPLIFIVIGCVGAAMVAAMRHPDPAATTERRDRIDHEAAVSAKWHGKPGSQIVALESVAVSLALHEQKAVVLELATPLRNGALHIHLQTDDGLMLVGPVTDWQFELANTPQIRLPVTLYAASEGRQYLHIFAELTDSEGTRSARALAWEVNVGQAGLATRHYKADERPAPAVVVLPANETVY